MSKTTKKERSCIRIEGKEIQPICYFCEKEVMEGDYCYGCEHYVCEECDRASIDIPLGGHNVDDHQPEEDEE